MLISGVRATLGFKNNGLLRGDGNVGWYGLVMIWLCKVVVSTLNLSKVGSGKCKVHFWKVGSSNIE